MLRLRIRIILRSRIRIRIRVKRLSRIFIKFKFRIRNHVCIKVKIQELWRFRMEPWASMYAHSGGGEGLYASGCRFASLCWGAGSGPHLSLRSNPRKNDADPQQCTSEELTLAVLPAMVSFLFWAKLFQFKSLLTMFFLHRRTRRVSSRWPSTRA